MCMENYGRIIPRVSKCAIWGHRQFSRLDIARHEMHRTSGKQSEGRKEIHRNLRTNTDILHRLMRNPVLDRSIEYADNRISLYAAQYGKCAVTGWELEFDEIHCHHKLPVEQGGTDVYTNLVIVHKDVHRLIHAKQQDTIDWYLRRLNLDSTMRKKLNRFRRMVGNAAI